jgi:hypothetical protein
VVPVLVGARVSPGAGRHWLRDGGGEGKELYGDNGWERCRTVCRGKVLSLGRAGSRRPLAHTWPTFKRPGVAPRQAPGGDSAQGRPLPAHY